MIPFLAGVFAGTFLGVLVMALARAAGDPQVPFLGPGTWKVEIGPNAECTEFERFIDFDASVRRLLEEES